MCIKGGKSLEIIVDFICTPERCVYNSDDFKIYGCSINSFEYPNIKINKYNNITVKGNITELVLGVEYAVKARETSDSYGVGYQVINIKRNKPTTLASARNFLYEIITERQADELLRVYPDIVDRVMNNNTDNIDLSKVRGIREFTFNIIKNKIIENFKLADIVEEFQGIFSLSIVKKLYSTYTSLDKIKEIIRQDPYLCLCNLGGVGFKTADSLLLELYKNFEKCKKENKKPVLFFNYCLPESYQRAKACVDYLLLENENSGNTYINIGELKKQFDILVPEAKNNLPIILKDENNGIIFDKELLAVCRKKTYDTEKYISDRIKEAMTTKIVWNYDYEKYQSLNGFHLTDKQCDTIRLMCKNNLVLLSGYAGSGKSFSTQALVKMLKDNNQSYLLLAPTGKAAKVLSGYIEEEAQTIHRGLGYMPPNQWAYDEEHKLPYDVVIVDEFSMVDIFLFKQLLAAIDFNKTKLLLIGDDAQIPSVGAGNILYDLLKFKDIPTVLLDKIFRYGKGGLSTVATDTRTQREYLDKENNSPQTFGEDQSYVFIPITQEKICPYAIKLYHSLLQKGYDIEDIALISCYNVGDYGTVALNKKIQNVVNPDPEAKIKFGETEFRINDIVMNYVNDYKAIIYNEEITQKEETTFIANGDSGRVVKILKDAMVVDYDGMLILVPKSSMKNIRLAYAISTHKCQGSSYKVVIFLTPKAHTYMLNSNLLYVGETRAREKCFHLGEIKTVNNAIKKKENFDRKTMLGRFLKSKENIINEQTNFYN